MEDKQAREGWRDGGQTGEGGEEGGMEGWRTNRVTPTRGGPAGRGGGRGLRRFEEIPHTGSSGWLNLVKFWREDRFKLLHKHMERTFNTLGPIYRYLCVCACAWLCVCVCVCMNVCVAV
uniref:Uncharacterized protein n=1 Tax=Salmo trutta TaxID=8032 RepID=A0A674CV45_SALTR